jgi:hypothetical protein
MAEIPLTPEQVLAELEKASREQRELPPSFDAPRVNREADVERGPMPSFEAPRVNRIDEGDVERGQLPPGFQPNLPSVEINEDAPHPLTDTKTTEEKLDMLYRMIEAKLDQIIDIIN